MGGTSMTWKGEAGSNRMLLGAVGAVFMGLALLMFVFGMTGGASSLGDMAFVLLFFLVGVGCFLAMDFSSSRNEEGLLILPEGMDARSLEEDEESPATAVQAGGNGGAPVGKEGADAMNHLERADFAFEKVKEAASEADAEAAVRQTVAVLKEKGYSDKGFAAFCDRLASNLAGLAGDQLPEQLAKNKRRALQVMAELRKAG